MWLELHKVKVRGVRWGGGTKVEGGVKTKQIQMKLVQRSLLDK